MDFNKNFEQFVQTRVNNNNEMKELETAIENSKANISNTPKRWQNRTKSQDVASKSVDQDITFQDFPKSSAIAFPLIHHKPSVPLPILTNAKYQNYSFAKRVRILSQNATKAAALHLQLARMSIFRAPQPDPIVPLGDEFTPAEEPPSPIQPKEVYLSRSGRTVKRKNYNEFADDEELAAAIMKKVKMADDDKITLEVPLNIETKKDSDDSDDAFTPIKKVCKRIPKKLPLSTRKSRSDTLFDNLMDQNGKTVEKEVEMERFEKSLVVEDDDSEGSPAKIAKIEENFIPRRVVPPLRGKYIKPKPKPDNKEEAPAQKLSPIMKRGKPKTERNTNAKAALFNDQNVPSTSKAAETQCPICCKYFDQDKIEQHASGCEGLEEVTITALPKSPSFKDLQCSICERKFTSATSYASHCMQCAAVFTDSI